MLALLLLLEKHAEASRWADYIAALPWSSELPLTWSPDEVAKLGGASPQWYIQEKQRKLEKAYASLVECMKGAALAELKAACPSSADFILAFSLAHSRAMGIPSVDGDGRRWRLAMLPFADMLNHSCEPQVEWDIIAAKTKDMSYVAAQTCCDVAQGSELRISYKRAGSAQGFFATYGFIEEVQDVCCTELRLEPWDGPGNNSVVSITSPQSLRRLMSNFRTEAASAEERQTLEKDPDTAAHFPLSQRCEVAALEKLLKCVRKRLEHCKNIASQPASHAVERLRQADLVGWKRLEAFAASVLDLIKDECEMSPARLAVLVHAHMRKAAAGIAPDMSTPIASTYLSEKLTIRDEGGEKGRGYYAERTIPAGELLLREEPHIFDAEDEDFDALSTVHVICAEEEGHELRSSTRDVSDASESDAFRWLAGVPAFSKDKVTLALAAARNNGFCTSIPDGIEVEAMFLFRRLSVFNHSCWPNCAVFRQPNGLAHVLAISPIEKGAELTIHYSDEFILLPRDLRKVFIQGRFGFPCECDRCEDPPEASAKAEALLQDHIAIGPAEAPLADAMKRAHAGLCKMQHHNNQPSGFVYKEYDRWEDALAAVENAMPHMVAYAAETHWARHHARGLQTLALEALQKDSKAYFVLAEHAAAAWKIMPRYCDALRALQKRLQQVKDRLPEGIKPRLEERAMALHGDSLQGLEEDVARVAEWLEKAENMGSATMAANE